MDRITLTSIIILPLILFNCTNPDKEKGLDQINTAVFDTTFYRFESLVVNGTHISESDTLFASFLRGDQIINIGEQFVFTLLFDRDSIWITPDSSSGAIWYQFGDTLLFGYSASRHRNKNQWKYMNDGTIHNSCMNPVSEVEQDSQFISNSTKSYVVLKQLKIPVERANHIRHIADTLNQKTLIENQSSHPDFNPEIWKN